jgi:hypothetical protein
MCFPFTKVARGFAAGSPDFFKLLDLTGNLNKLHMLILLKKK